MMLFTRQRLPYVISINNLCNYVESTFNFPLGIFIFSFIEVPFMSNAINSIHKCIFNKDMPAFVISVATTVNLHLDCRHCIRAGPLSCQLQLYALLRTNHSIHDGECVQGNISNCVRLMKQNLQKSLLLRERPGSFQRDTFGSATFYY
jgi:hypothetical protein